MFSRAPLYKSKIEDGKLFFDLNDFHYFGKEENTLSMMSYEIEARRPINFEIELDDRYRKELAEYIPKTKSFIIEKRNDRLAKKRKMKPIDAVAGVASAGAFISITDPDPVVNLFGTFGSFFITTSLTCYLRDRIERKIAKNTGYIKYLDRIEEELCGV